MKTNKLKILIFLILVILNSCCPEFTKNRNYYELGPAILQASSLFLTIETDQLPEKIDGIYYKSLLKDEYENLYLSLVPFYIEIEKIENDYLVKLYDGDKLVLTDLTATEGKLDNWEFDK